MAVKEKIEAMRSQLDEMLEDHREEGESIEDAFKKNGEELKKALDDIAEDHREEGEEMEKLRNDIATITGERDKALSERDEAHRVFMVGGKGNKDKEEAETYADAVKGLK